MTNKTIDTYHRQAQGFAEQYDSVPAEQVHAEWLAALQGMPVGRALDVGAGSGRDARWLACLGWQVSAVEPAEALREIARSSTPASVDWIDDTLPELARITASGHSYELILLSAVWMHLLPEQRRQAFKVLAGCLAPDGLMVITLRFGPSDPARPMYEVSVGELAEMAAPLGLVVSVSADASGSQDRLGRADVRWQTVLIRHRDGEASA
ncbi:MAG: class I SAM-dependent methyltransferase [Oceanospirillaceae bacterium]|nr:class I SAM-dependent methyltransferase [Oceanospirillaceae bacterium]